VKIQELNLEESPAYVPAYGFNSYYDYAFACSNTPAVTWEVDNKTQQAVGVVFGNIQVNR